MKLFLDIDGVLLRWKDGRLVSSKGARQFLTFVVERYDCHWLTTHCKGKVSRTLDYLRPYLDEESIKAATRLKPTIFDVLKTDALPANESFYWIDDAPLESELRALEEMGRLDCWLQVDTNRNEDSLVECLSYLKDQTGRTHP